MPDQPPPPFRPFRAVPGADPKDSALAFLEWTADGIWRIHAMTEANYRYSRATYEATVAASRQPAGARPGAPVVVNDQLINNLGRLAYHHRGKLASILKGLLGRP
jgi:hypothetical protein